MWDVVHDLITPNIDNRVSGTEKYKPGGRTVFLMPRCLNCESFVTENYVRVFAPTGMDSVRVCPRCEDKLRDGAEVRKARSTRGNS